jgi:hypothetical protein
MTDVNQLLAQAQQLPVADRKTLTRKTMSDLPPQDQNDVASQIRPSPTVADITWLIIVASFAVVFVTVALSIVASVMKFTNQAASDTAPLITVFTASATFLAGLLSPSPIQTGKGTSNGAG